jgi:transposase
MLASMAAPEEIDLTALPAPALCALIEAERTARRALEQEVAALAEQNRRLEHLVREFRQALHGRKSEMSGSSSSRTSRPR